jgi:hypothetical protein
MVRKILDEIDPILYQHFNKVRDEMVEKRVAARRLVSMNAPCLRAPTPQIGEEPVAVRIYNSRS